MFRRLQSFRCRSRLNFAGRSIAVQNVLEKQRIVPIDINMENDSQLSQKIEYGKDTKCENPRIKSLLDSSKIHNDSNNLVRKIKNRNIDIYLKLQKKENEHIPEYLETTYWWAYIHPNAVKFWERQWLVNAILFNNFNLLVSEALKEIGNNEIIEHKSNLNVLQMAAVYGNFSSKLANSLLTRNIISSTCQNSSNNNNNNNNDNNDDNNNRKEIISNDRLEIVDIAPIQLKNTQNKLISQLSTKNNNINSIENDRHLTIVLNQNDSSIMENNNSNSYDIIFVFFLLHEQPENIREKTINQSMRLLKQNGKIIFIDYHRPYYYHPLWFLMRFILTYIEPFAIDLWNNDITSWIDAKKYKQISSNNNSNNNKDNNNNTSDNSEIELYTVDKTTYFGGLYQKVIVSKI